MLFNVIFVCSISVAVANYEDFNSVSLGTKLSYENESLQRTAREVKEKNTFELKSLTCEEMSRTQKSPFVVLVLLKTSGRFLGMGSIIDKQTILTAKRVIEHAYQNPDDLRVLAGRLGPWWGKNSQVKTVQEVIFNDAQLALLKIDDPFRFDKFVGVVRLYQKPEPMFDQVFGQDFVVFGVPRSSWDMPGELTPKGCSYIMKTETALQKKEGIDACKAAFPDLDGFNDTYNMCTSANGSFCWGCIGSPTIALTAHDELFQVALITHTTTTESDIFHVHTLISYFDMWIRSQTNINYKMKD